MLPALQRPGPRQKEEFIHGPNCRSKYPLLATKNLLENTDGVLGAATCYLLVMLTRAILMPSLFQRPVGERLAAGAYNLVYGGAGAATGPTLSSCAVDAEVSVLTLQFNTSLLAGDKIVLTTYNSTLNNMVYPPPPVPTNIQPCFEAVKTVCAGHLHNHTDCGNCKTAVPGAWDKLKAACGSRPINNFHEACHSFFPAQEPLRGSLVEVLVGQGSNDGSAAFCIEPLANGTEGYCPPWAGGPVDPSKYDADAGRWVAVDILSADATSVGVDLSKLPAGKTAVAVRYSWGVFDCCNTGDPMLYVDKPCDNACPITSSSNFPANPFIAKIVGRACSCVAPQVC